MVDVLAVGEPIELAALARITDPAAVEEADTRGLITVESVVGGLLKCGWRTRSTGRYAAGARHPPGYGGCGDWSRPNSPHPRNTTTSKSWCDAPR